MRDVQNIAAQKKRVKEMFAGGTALLAVLAAVWLICCPVFVQAGQEKSYLDTWMSQLDFADLDGLSETELFPGQREKLEFSDVVKAFLADGIAGFDYSMVLAWLKDALLYELNANRRILLEVLLLAVAFSAVKNFSGAFRQAYVSEICFFLVYGILAVLLLESFTMYSAIVTEALNQSVDFMKALVPVFCVSMVFSAGAETSAGFYQIAFLVIYLIQWLFLKVLMPLIQIYVILELFNHFFEDEKFLNLTELLAGIVNWGLKSAGVAVLGLNVVQGLIAPVKDKLVSGTVTRAASFIPGVGNAVNGIGELLLGSGILIKNCVGAAALLFLAAIAMIPVAKILCMSVLYKLAAAVAEPVADKRIAGCIKGMAAGGMLYMKLLLYCLALLFVTIALGAASSAFMQ